MTEKLQIVKLGEVHEFKENEDNNVTKHYDTTDSTNPNAIKTLGKIHKFRANEKDTVITNTHKIQ